MFKTKTLSRYAEYRNEKIEGKNTGLDYLSSKLSPWLANGSLSVRFIYFQVKEFEKQNGATESTKVYASEL
jgi:deoxyribodipyrimidine photo-lyase